MPEPILKPFLLLFLLSVLFRSYTCKANSPIEQLVCASHTPECAAGVRAMQAQLRPIFCLFGDSLTQRSFDEWGWGADLAALYCRKADIVLRGYGGFNTRWVLPILKDIFPASMAAHPPRLVTVWFGANDSVLPDHRSAKQHVPLEEYKANLRRIVEHLKGLNVPDILFITPPPVDEAARIAYYQQTLDRSEWEGVTSERHNAVAGQYAEAMKDMGRQLGLPVLDLWMGLQERGDWQSLLSDGLHFTPAGQRAVSKLVQQAIVTKLPALRESELLQDFAWHGDIDVDDLDNSVRKRSK